MDACILTNTIYKNEPAYVGISDRAKREYCSRHGMDFLHLHANPHPESHPCWSKPSLLAWALMQYEWVVWMDADAMPTNYGVNIVEYLQGVKEPVVMAQDINGFNAGVIGLRRDAREWLLAIDERRHYPQYTIRFREQQAMADSINAGEMACHIPPLDLGFNDYMPWLYNRTVDRNIFRRGVSWCLHLPAVNDDSRRGIMEDVFQ